MKHQYLVIAMLFALLACWIGWVLYADDLQHIMYLTEDSLRLALTEEQVTVKLYIHEFDGTFLVDLEYDDRNQLKTVHINKRYLTEEALHCFDISDPDFDYPYDIYWVKPAGEL